MLVYYRLLIIEDNLTIQDKMDNSF